MEVRYQCGAPSKEWRINMLHKVGKKKVRHIIESVEINAPEDLVRKIKYKEVMRGGVVVSRVAILRFKKPISGTAVAQLREMTGSVVSRALLGEKQPKITYKE